MHDFLVTDTGVLAMTAENADALVVRPQPSHDDAVPNANGVFAENLVRLAALTGAEEDRGLAEDALSTLSSRRRPGAARPHDDPQRPRPAPARADGRRGERYGRRPHRRGAAPALPRALGLPLADGGALAPDHPAKSAAFTGAGPQALVCAGMRCSLPVATAAELERTAREMLASSSKAAAEPLSRSATAAKHD